jgi:type I restriction enzyme, R subunit
MNEAETRAELIDPALKLAGWGIVPDSRMRLEVIAPGRLEGGGRKGKQLKCDYVLTFRNRKLAAIEAKRKALPFTEGVGQAKDYAARLQTRFAYATNGVGIYEVDMQTGKEREVLSFPTPDELWRRTFAEYNLWRDRFAAIPFETLPGKDARYYQDNAIQNTLDAIADGRKRILLTLATGTGKTFIAFQLAWKLFQAKWSLSGEPTRRPRILFLADRNILADQAYNAFSAFAEDALVRIKPDEIARKGRVPKNGSVFFTIFQTFMSGPNETPNFGDYPPDFFDFIIIDECHRGGAKDESSWRAILDYFAPAVQLGLTATPKRSNNIDTYAYFGEPVYTYSLKQGINDGYLTPFKVRQIATTLDEYVYTQDDKVVEGELEDGKRYREADFNRIIEIKEREHYRVKLFLEMMDQKEKTLVFCASQAHALAVRDLVNQMKTSQEPDYCARVTANDGAIGDQHFEAFKDNEKTIPTILTTSRKLSTGIDARNVRNIVLMRPVNSMIEFKQIIGRGTRLFEGKDHFTIYDFVKAYEHFNDPEWDGEPLEIDQPTPKAKPEGFGEPEQPVISDNDNKLARPQKLVIRLADGKARTIQHMSATTYWSADGKPISANQFIENLFGELPAYFKDEDELRKLWSVPETRKRLLEGLADKGFGGDKLVEIRKMIDAEKSDLFDVLAYIAFTLAPITREERASSKRLAIHAHYDDRLKAFLDFVLGQYVKEGDEELGSDKLAELINLKYGTPADAIRELGNAATIREAFIGFQRFLYED